MTDTEKLEQERAALAEQVQGAREIVADILRLVDELRQVLREALKDGKK